MQSLMGGTPKTALHRFVPHGKENCYQTTRNFQFYPHPLILYFQLF
ncbi:hypothetical protein [Moorena sp. SIO3F7]|nr:hypothetical protein [Moorena sp. SIO3F7]NEQ01274.1 hypothetical protein [Moorena sp. SIO3F7]